MNWIVINEERSNLPELCTDVLVTYSSYGSVSTQLAFFDSEGGFCKFHGGRNWNDKVIAWMYLPEAYKPPKLTSDK